MVGKAQQKSSERCTSGSTLCRGRHGIRVNDQYRITFRFATDTLTRCAAKTTIENVTHRRAGIVRTCQKAIRPILENRTGTTIKRESPASGPQWTQAVTA